jgi:cytochrome c5
VSKQDSQFFNILSIVIGGLIAIALVLFGIARCVGKPFEERRAQADAVSLAQLAERTAPVGKVAIAGQDNSQLAIAAATTGTAAPAAAALPASSEETYRTLCSTCHAAGIAGAPKAGDRAAWAPRLAQGKDLLYRHALEGFQGKNGVMPAKGGRTDLPDQLVKDTVDYLVSLNP